MNILKKALLVVLGAGLVVVPSTLDKVEEVNAASISGGSVIYLVSNDSWNSDNAKMGAYFFNSGKTGDAWSTDVHKKATNTNYFKFTVPAGSWNSVIFVRMSNSSTSGSWNNKWNQTVDISLDTSKNVWKISSPWANKATGSWETTPYYEYNLKLDYNGGTDANNKTSLEIPVKAGTYTANLTIPTKPNHNFIGWTVGTGTKVEVSANDKTYNSNFTGNVTLKAAWEEIKETTCSVDFKVGNIEFDTIYVDKGTELSKAIEKIKEDLELNKLVVVDWDKTGPIEEDTTITAEKYYTELEKISAQLYMDYEYKTRYITTNVYLEFYPKDSSNASAKITAKDSTTLEEKEFEMIQVTPSEGGNKALFVADVPLNYDLIKFSFVCNESTESNQNVNTDFLTRDFVNNASWYDWSGSNGFFSYEKVDIVYDTVNVENVKLRFTTDYISASSFKGVSTYGIRIAKGSAIADDNYYGPTWTEKEVLTENGNIIWSAAINNVTDYNQEFTAVPYVVIDNEKYDLCKPRTLSIAKISEEYKNDTNIELDSTVISALDYIIESVK